jgi:superfamily I DNA/RNA helicase
MIETDTKPQCAEMQTYASEERVLSLTFTREGVNQLTRRLGSFSDDATSLSACERSMGYCLTREQRAFVEDATTSTSHIVVEACAGSGKTSALVAFAHLLVNGDKKNEDEYDREERMARLASGGDSAQRFRHLERDALVVRSFHSFCGALL